RNSGSGRTRTVAPVSRLISASHSGEPQNPPYANPPASFMNSTNCRLVTPRIVCASRRSFATRKRAAWISSSVAPTAAVSPSSFTGALPPVRRAIITWPAARSRGPSSSRNGAPFASHSKYFEWEAKGAPLRLELGPRDLAAGQVMMARRTGGKAPVKLEGLTAAVGATLDEIQAALFRVAKERREAHTIRGVTKRQFVEFMKDAGGFAYGGFCGSPECEAEIKRETGATVRVLPDPEF